MFPSATQTLLKLQPLQGQGQLGIEPNTLQQTSISSGYNPGNTPLQQGNSFSSVLQPQQFYNQQQPNQVGVTYYNLHPLANPPLSSWAQQQLAMTPAQTQHDLGLDKPTVLQGLPSLPSNFKPAPTHQSFFHKLVGLL